MKRAAELALSPLLLCLVAGALGSLALFAIACGLAVVYFGLHGAVLRAESRAVVVRRIHRTEVVEGQPIQIHFDVAGLNWLPVAIERRCECGEWHALPTGESTVDCAIARPGRHVIEASPLRIRDDLGLFTRPLSAGEPEEVLVLPAPAVVPTGSRRGAIDSAHDPEPDGLRTYVRGTPISRIHWPSVARGGELQERMFTMARDHLPLVVVDTSGASDGAAVDWTARTAAGEVLALAREGGCRVMLPGDRVPTTVMDPISQWPAMHRRLADLGRGGPASGTRIDLREAVQVRASMAPAEADDRAPLPPGVVAAGTWAEEA